MKAIVLTDGKAGHENQSKAFVRALGLECDIVNVRFAGRFSKMASYVRDRLGTPRLEDLEFEGGPDRLRGKGYAVVAGTGSGTFYAAKTLSRAIGAKCGVVLYPRGYRLDDFDCILAPSFDRPAKKRNIIEIPANLVAADEAFYARGVEGFRERYRGAEDDLVAVVVGGPNKCSAMPASWMKSRLDEIFAAHPGSQLCVTTSRRTPRDVESLVDSYPWTWKLIYSRDSYNPIPAFVKLAKCIYVTAESTGMLSEACTYGSSRVVALDNLKPGGSKFRRFVENLRAGGYVDGSRKIDLSGAIASAKALLGIS